jgi:hypothetical protein
MKQLKTTNLKKSLDRHIKSIAIQGINNIKSELTKRGQDANVTYSIKGRKIKFIVEPKTEKIETDKLPAKEGAKFKDILGPIPIEMLNQEMSRQSFSTAAVDKAIDRTRISLNRKINETIKHALI